MEDICSSVKSINVKFHTGTLEIDVYIVSNIILGRLWRENSRLFRTKVFFLLFSNLTLLNTVSIIIKLQKCRNLQGHATIPFMKTGQNMKGEKIVNLRARGLVAITTVFEQYVKEETSKNLSHGIKNLCTTCLHECFNKRRFTKLLPKGQTDQLKNKVQVEVRRTRRRVCSDYC